jgi:hypothetical protein
MAQVRRALERLWQHFIGFGDFLDLFAFAFLLGFKNLLFTGTTSPQA